MINIKNECEIIDNDKRKYNIRPTDPNELMRAVIWFQQHDDDTIELIKPKGYRLAEVPKVKEHKLDWTPSGLKNPNAWRNKH